MSRVGVVLALALAACRPAGPLADPADGPGVHQLTLPLTGGRELRYTLLVPEGGGTRPLVLALHYGGEVTPFYGRGILELLVAPALAELGAVIAAPETHREISSGPRSPGDPLAPS